MDDQFGGRTDDDLFFDDFEPVVESHPVVNVQPSTHSKPVASVEDVAPPPPPTPPTAVATPPIATPPVEPSKSESAPAPKPVAQQKPRNAPKGLANSRFNPNRPAPTPAAAPPPQPPTGPAAQTTAAPPTGPKSASPAPGSNTGHVGVARLQSGGNPRTKLTETELAVKMEQMRILNAEKTRKFEQAEQDERSHAEAYARGMEQARKRKQAEEERRRRGEEERRRMDDERAKNRERKLKAMSMKEGGWDEGKEALAAEDERRGFRGANGGIRGARSGGLGGSMFANEGEPEGSRYDDGEDRRGRRDRGRGRGRGQGRGGRGGRGGHGNDFERDSGSNGTRDPKPAATQPKAPAPKAPAITTDEFPALPGAKEKTGDISPPVLSPLNGRWDDEMEAFDAKMKSEAQS